MKKISIIVPVYNEEKTLVSILDKLVKLDLGMEKEIIIVDDGSKDNSPQIIRDYIKENSKLKKLKFKSYQKENGGKGSAIKKGFELATGDIVTIQDADQEYDPEDYKKLIKPIVRGEYSVVYGSRFLRKHKPKYKIYFWGNKFLTLITAILYKSRITDMETCYKVFKKEIVKNINLKANKFDMEPEITSKILRRGIKIKELPISYIPRSIDEGKKINWKDGLKAIYTLFYWRFLGK